MQGVINNISVVIIAKNSEKSINNCLSATIFFHEVIIYLNNSTDRTREIASKFSNVKIIDGPFLGFGKTKRKATEYASNDWILSIDSDECINAELLDSLRFINLNKDCVYKVKTQSFYKNQRILFCGLGNEKRVRLFNRKTTNFNDSIVHEKIIDKNFQCITLNGYIKHYSYYSISDFIQKTDFYSSLYAEQNSKYSSPILAILKSIVCFANFYIIKFGFLDGYVGFLVSYSNANYVFYKYLKLYAKNKKL